MSLEAQIISLREQRNSLPRGSAEREALTAKIHELINSSGLAVSKGTSAGIVGGTDYVADMMKDFQSGMWTPTGSIVTSMGGQVFQPSIIGQALKALGYSAVADAVIETITGGQGFPSLYDAVQYVIQRLDSASGGIQTGQDSRTISYTGGFKFPEGRRPNLKEQGLDADNFQVGTMRHGFAVKNCTRYVKGQAKTTKEWYKPLRLFTPNERMAGSQYYRMASVEWSKMLRKAKKRSYNAGKRKGAELQRQAQSGQVIVTG